MRNPDERPIVVLGLGNMLMADDGIGLAALTRLQDEWFMPPDVELPEPPRLAGLGAERPRTGQPPAA